jgi:hypothetical protein
MDDPEKSSTSTFSPETVALPTSCSLFTGSPIRDGSVAVLNRIKREKVDILRGKWDDLGATLAILVAVNMLGLSVGQLGGAGISGRTRFGDDGDDRVDT